MEIAYSVAEEGKTSYESYDALAILTDIFKLAMSAGVYLAACKISH